MSKKLTIVGAFAACTLLFSGNGNATTSAAFDAAWSTCAAATHQVERERGIPRDLLTAISLAESGRWDNINRETHAWPWTVTSGEETWRADTKDEAIQRVRTLQASGVENIDVGCMQINLYFHPDAFSDLDAALDPLTNARYAGAFLSRLYGSSQNWLTAAGNYHSSTQRFHERYKLKVARFWNDRRNGTTPETATATTAQVPQQTAPTSAAIDYQRMAQLNQAFRARQVAAQQAIEQQQTASVRPGAVSPLVGDRYALNAQIQRVRKEAERRNRINDLVRSERVPGIASNQQEDINPDLLLWRNLYRSGPTNGPFLSGN